MKKTACVILLVLLVQYVIAAAESFSDKPCWVKGKLLFTALGSTELYDATTLPIDLYVCCIDFDSEQITTRRVPLGSHIFSDSSTGSSYLFTPAIPDFGFEESHWTWLNKIEISRIEGNTEGFKCTSPKHFATKYPVLDVSHYAEESEYLYYLTILNTNAEGMTELGLIRERNMVDVWDGNERRVKLAGDSTAVLSFDPWDWDFVGRSEISISKNGNLAYRRREENNREIGLYVYDMGEETEKTLLPSECQSGAFCWLNEEQLIYCSWEDTEIQEIRLWNTNDGSVDSLAALWNGDISYVVSKTRITQLALNPEKTILAFYH